MVGRGCADSVARLIVLDHAACGAGSKPAQTLSRGEYFLDNAACGAGSKLAQTGSRGHQGFCLTRQARIPLMRGEKRDFK
jgi:hypothetical protein